VTNREDSSASDNDTHRVNNLRDALSYVQVKSKDTKNFDIKLDSDTVHYINDSMKMQSTVNITISSASDDARARLILDQTKENSWNLWSNVTLNGIDCCGTDVNEASFIVMHGSGDVKHCSFDNVVLYVTSSPGCKVLISDNEFKNIQAPSAIICITTTTTIVNNKIHNCRNHGIYVFHYGYHTDETVHAIGIQCDSFSRVDGNTIAQCGGAGLFIEHGYAQSEYSHNLIENCQVGIRHVIDEGSSLSDVDSKMIDNRIINCKDEFEILFKENEINDY